MGRSKSARFSPGTRRYGTKSRYTQEQLESIEDDLRTGKIGQREAAKKYGIPRNTLRNKLLGKHEKKVGLPLTFSPEEENTFVTHIAHISDLGCPISLFDARLLAKFYLESNKN